jgi:phosphoribosylamine--glycine ligase
VQDHKRIGEGDTGPNTGGMGAYAPVPESVIPPSMVRRAEAAILRPLIDGLARRGTPIQGILFAGLMATAEGPKAIEYNVRGGDPEIPTVLPLLESDLFLHFQAVVEGALARCPMRFRPGFALNIVLASAGYPGPYESGKPISGLDRVGGALVFHAGTARRPDGSLATAGGRVLDVVAVASDLAEAQRMALAAAETIAFEGKQFRRDIGAKALAAAPAR